MKIVDCISSTTPLKLLIIEILGIRRRRNEGNSTARCKDKRKTKTQNDGKSRAKKSEYIYDVLSERYDLTFR